MLPKTADKKPRQNLQLSNFKGLKDGSLLPLIVTLLCISAAGVILYFTEGNIKIMAAFFALAAVVTLTIYRLDYSFFLLIGMVLVFDQFLVPGFKPFTYYVDFFRNFKEISYLPASHPAAVINPIEVYLMLLVGTWLIILAVQKKVTLQKISVWPAFLFFLICLVFAFLNGLYSGGDIVIAIWEFRALFYLSVMYIAVPQIIQTKKQIRILLWVFILGIFFKAAQAIFRYASAGFTAGGLQTFTNHEDPVFMTTLFIFLGVLLLLKYKDRQRTWMLFLALPLLLGFLLSFRRAALAGLIVSLATLFVILGKEELKRYLGLAIPAATLLIIYGAFSWNSQSPYAEPVQMIKSGIMETSKVENPEDYYSNLYREYENFNLATTIAHQPISGVGFGKKFKMPLDLDKFVVSYPLRDYIAHNQIIWWFAKTGIIGFFSFWLFFNAFANKGASVYAKIKDPYLKAVCAMVVVAVINQMVVSYFDLQLTYYRNMIYLGTLMGLMPTLERIGQKNSELVDEPIA